MDDVTYGCKLCNTYKDASDNHFKSLEKIIERIVFHSLKLKVVKCEFAIDSVPCFLISKSKKEVKN
jgi:hypothetical protein